MKCSDITELLSAYANDELSPTQKEFVEKHIVSCVDCQATLADFRVVRERLTSLRATPAISDMKGTIMSKIKGADTPNAPGRRWMRPVAVAIPIVAILVTVLALYPWGSLLSPQNVMAKAYAALADLQSFRMEVSANGTSEDENIEATFELMYAAKDRYHLKSVQNGIAEETIVIGDRVFSRGREETSSSNYTTTATNIDFSFVTPSKERTLELLSTLTDVELLDEETLDGVTCFHYQGRVDMAKGYDELINRLDPNKFDYEARKAAIDRQFEWLRNWKNEVQMWIGKDDYLIRKVTQFTQMPPFNPEDKGSAVNVITRYGDFNKPITIDPPVDADGKLLPGWIQLQ